MESNYSLMVSSRSLAMDLKDKPLAVFFMNKASALVIILGKIWIEIRMGLYQTKKSATAQNVGVVKRQNKSLTFAYDLMLII